MLQGHNLPAVKKDNFVFNLLSFLVLRFPSPDMAQHFHSCGEFLRFFLLDSFLIIEDFFFSDMLIILINE